ncbi:class I SAM-dependent methyltransferase [Kitasatospora viridis]|uniref:Methyltransferase family protein n=1 Tax=Kitasatospora viridis TaxID=281105 RepID=A0A561UEG8_9ACTN|nr:methyltransferase domain-containing protein [Kitasatospora viridis]TWF97735.1 methyltransferase family protein [Kitasatospora viridis]
MAPAHGTATQFASDTPPRPPCRARDWAEIQERTMVPLYEAVHERLAVGPATSLFGLGCRSGLALLLAAGRGARVAGQETDPQLRELARARGLSVAAGPADAVAAGTRTAHAVVTLFEPLRLGPDPRRAVRSAVRLARPGGVLVLAGLTAPEDGPGRAALRVAARFGGRRTADPLDPAGGPGGLAAGAGLRVLGRGRADCPFGYPDLPGAVRGLLATGWFDAAAAFAGEQPVAKELAEALHPLARPDGSVWLPFSAEYLLAVRA